MDKPQAKVKKPLSSIRSYARIAAVQALYRLSVAGEPLEDVLAYFVASELDKIAPPDKADEKFFLRLVQGTVGQLSEVDSLITQNLDEGWTINRLDLVTLNILRAGMFELLALKDVPKAVVINEYVDVARAFSEGDESKFVNGLLDRAGKTLRDKA